MSLFLRNLIFTVVVPGTVAVYVPLFLFAHREVGWSPSAIGGAFVVLTGAFIYWLCIRDFASFGRGTPAPLDPPRHLVERGLYRYSRNPMYVGVLTVIFGWAIVWWSAGIALYGIAVGIGFHLFVRLYEEPHLARVFGAPYAQYRARVGRWGPFLPPHVASNHLGDAKLGKRRQAVSRPGAISVRALADPDRPWVREFVTDRWGEAFVVGHGVTYRPDQLAGFVAANDRAATVGLLTYVVRDDAFEIVTIDSVCENAGVGTALLDAATAEARRLGCRRIWLVTTNDNIRALGFYQRRGFELVAVHRGALAHTRKLKPELPLVSADGIPLRDEIELELPLAEASAGQPGNTPAR